VNIVDVRDSAAVNFLAASDGQTVTEQGQVRTGSSSTAQLDFSDGGIVRLAQNTSVVIDQLGGTDGDPLSRLTLGMGQLSVRLTRGQFQVQTPLGVAAVHGSYAEFLYGPASAGNGTHDDALTIECIEGICAFDNGNSPIIVGNLRQLVITQGGRTLTGPTDLPASAVKDFLAHSPDSAAVVLTLTAAAPSATTVPSATDSPVPTDTATRAPTATNTPRPTPTRTRRPPALVPSDTPAPSDTPLPGDTPLPTVTDTSK
jgi:hypothetical protein